MSSEVPLKIRVDIRDQWDSSKAPIHDYVEALTKNLGHKIKPEAEWPALWNILHDRFADKSVFVPTVVRYTIAWYERLAGRLDNDVNETWTEELLSVLVDPRSSLKLKIEPCPPNMSRPFTKWNKTLGYFQLGVPKSDPVSAGTLANFFDADFESFFKDEEPGGADEDWDQVEVKQDAPPVPEKAAGGRLFTAEPPKTYRLPVVATLSRPKDLLATTSPYYLIVSTAVDNLVVQCSHEGSLELLSAYLLKWIKVNPNDNQRRPFFDVQLVESDFCFGFVDTLTVKPIGRYNKNINPTLILAFVEGVLGYEMVHTTGGTWTFKCSTIYK